MPNGVLSQFIIPSSLLPICSVQYATLNCISSVNHVPEKQKKYARKTEWAWQALAFLSSRPVLVFTYFVFSVICALLVSTRVHLTVSLPLAVLTADGRATMSTGTFSLFVTTARLSNHSSHSQVTNLAIATNAFIGTLDPGNPPPNASIQPFCSSFTPSAYIHFTKYLQSLVTSRFTPLRYSIHWPLSHVCSSFLRFVHPSLYERGGGREALTVADFYTRYASLLDFLGMAHLNPPHSYEGPMLG